MSFEGFLRTLPLVKRHLTRTIRLTFENEKFRSFLDNNGVDPKAVLKSTSKSDFNKIVALLEKENLLNQSSVNSEMKLELAEKRIEELELKLLVLKIDYDNLLVKSIRPTDQH